MFKTFNSVCEAIIAGTDAAAAGLKTGALAITVGGETLVHQLERARMASEVDVAKTQARCERDLRRLSERMDYEEASYDLEMQAKWQDLGDKLESLMTGANAARYERGMALRDRVKAERMKREAAAAKSKKSSK